MGIAHDIGGVALIRVEMHLKLEFIADPDKHIPENHTCPPGIFRRNNVLVLKPIMRSVLRRHMDMPFRFYRALAQAYGTSRPGYCYGAGPGRIA